MSIEEAFERLVRLHNADVREFDAAVERLPSFGPSTDALLGGWARAVRYNVYGFALWESVALRYQSRKAVVGDRSLVAPVVTIEPARASGALGLL